VVEASLQMRLGKAQTFENGMNLRFDLSVALVESLNLGAPRFDATLVDTAFATSAYADRAVTGGTFEASAELNVTDSFSVYGGGRLAFYSDDSWWWSAKGGVKVGF
jgi:hypothetical protein